jgi:hypothetical protein
MPQLHQPAGVGLTAAFDQFELFYRYRLGSTAWKYACKSLFSQINDRFQFGVAADPAALDCD